jgi:tripartite-type tricarboxylate transporter receptor subunit TctC
MVHIPYRGAAPALLDLIGGQTQAMFPSLAGATPHLRSGRLRALAVTGNKRHPNFPDIPTLAESGLKGFDAEQWYGVVAPMGTPAPIIQTLNQAMAAVLTQADFKAKLSAEAIEPAPMAVSQFASYVQADLSRWQKLAKERNIRLDD